MNIRVLRLAGGLITLLAPVMACGQGSEQTAVMPDVTGRKLDVALRDIKNAGVDEDVDVDGGGMFGIIDKPNWTVCVQNPPAGQAVSAAPRLQVDRSCTDAGPAGSTTTAVTSTTSTTLEQRKSGTPFGQNVDVKVRSSTKPGWTLSISVAAPVPFKPSDPADAKHTTNIYFTVTITNTSPDPYDPSSAIGEALCGLGRIDPSLDHLAGKGTKGDPIYDSKSGVSSLDIPKEIAPGQSITFKDGFSVPCGDDVTYKLRPAGLASDTLFFQR